MTEQRKLPEAGLRPARLNRYIKAGKHTVEGFQGAPDFEAPQIILGWELLNDMTDEDEPRPMWIKSFGKGNINDYNTEKSKKTKWFSQMFFEYDMNADNAETYLGRACRVGIKHNEGKGKYADRKFANLVDVRDLDESPDLPKLSQEPVFFDFYNPTVEGIQKLFPWEIDFLKEANDYAGSKLEAMLNESEENTDEQSAGSEQRPDF